MGNSIKCPVCGNITIVRVNNVKPIGLDHDIQMIVSDCGHLCGCIDNTYFMNVIHGLSNLTKLVESENHR